jgi:hypothetical protein
MCGHDVERVAADGARAAEDGECFQLATGY